MQMKLDRKMKSCDKLFADYKNIYHSLETAYRTADGSRFTGEAQEAGGRHEA